MNNNQRFLITSGLCTAMVIAGTSGCENSEVARLNIENETLKAENADLKNKLVSAKAEVIALKKAEAPGQQAQAGSGSNASTGGSPGTTAQQAQGSQATTQQANQPTTQQTTQSTTQPKPQNAQPVFTDLKDVPNQELIQELVKAGMFADLSPSFKPYRPITRGEYATWLLKANNALQLPAKQIHMAPQLSPQFKDLPASHACYKYVQALTNAGFSVGYVDGTFRPDKPITREEMIAMKVGVDMGKSSEPQKGQMAFVWKFSDARDVDDRYSGYVHDDYYISGNNGGNIKRAFGKLGAFKPRQAVLRCEAAGTLWQFGHGDWARTAANAAVSKQES